MKLLLPVLLFSLTAHCQFSSVIKTDLTKDQTFDRALVWCSKSFNDSKSAINVKEREGGIIAGKGYLNEPYMAPKKKDSALSRVYSGFLFDWTIEARDNKLRFSVIKVYYPVGDKQILVTDDSKPPFQVWTWSEEKQRIEWDLSKKAFLGSLQRLSNSLESDLKKEDW